MSTDQQPDVVVVGSGPSAAVAATELVARGVRVTMLDAGAGAPRGVLLRVRGNTVLRFVRGSMETERHVAVGDPTTAWFSSRSLGGLSNYWTAAVPRFHPLDFTEGEAVDERYRWPVTYDDMEPYYAIVERHMTVTSGDPQPRVPPNVRTFVRRQPADWLDLAERVRPAGHSLGAMPMAQGRPTTLVARPTGWNSWHCMIRPLLRAPNFRLVRNAEVVRLRWSPAAGRVDAVEYVDRAVGGPPRTVPAAAVVVAAGTLDTTRILLQSRSDDFPDGLGNTDGLVGRYLHDHPRQWWPARLGRPMTLLAHPMYIARRPHGDDEPLMATSLTIGMVGVTTRVRAWYGGTSDLVGVQVFGTMVPRPDHTAVLPRGRDLDEELRTPLRLDVRYDEQAVRNMDDARDRFRAVFAAGGVDATPEGPFHDLQPGSSVHYSGTVRMHADRRHGVLDAWNRIHDAPNVLVTDMSAFTTCPEKNPTLTAMALSARAVHRLAEDLAGG